MKAAIARITAALTVGFFTATSALAVPAKPGLMTKTQPDGSKLEVQLIGDERSHFYITADGYPLTEQDGAFYYANADADGRLISTSVLAASQPRRDAGAKALLQTIDKTAAIQRIKTNTTSRPHSLKSTSMRVPTTNPAVGLFPGTAFPSMGEKKALVILVEYKDKKFTLTDPHTYFNNMLNQPGFSQYSGTGSARDFFIESSGGQFIPQFDLFGPVTLSQNMSYYGGNDWYGNDQRPEEMVVEACALLDAQIDFNDYDLDGDGKVDNVFIFYAGQGEASGGAANTVWPHSWELTSAGKSVYHDGVQVDRYGCSNEWESGRPDGVGTFVHEFSHVMGLPDLYATSYTSSFTPGSWSALDYGPYNNDGCTPPRYGAFERYALGWLTPEEINGPANVQLQSIGSNEAYIIPTQKETEFFLLENRQQESWDTYIPGHGMLIWHVDFNSSIWNSNKVNNTPSHQYVDIEEADGTQTESSRDGDAFPGTKNVTSFTSTTSPAMKTWTNVGLDFPITDIAEQNGIITFLVCGGAAVPAIPVATEASMLMPNGFTANWNAVNGAYGYYLSVYTRAENSTARIYVPGWQKKDVGLNTAVKVEGLENETTYYYSVASYNEEGASWDSNEIALTTLPAGFEFRSPEAIEATDIDDYSFTARWNEMPEAVDYHLDVYTKIPGDPFFQTVDLTGGIAMIPEGWSTTTSSTYSMKSYCGAATPSLRMTSNGDYLRTPLMDEDIVGFKFWHRGSKAPADATVTISAFVDGAWKRIVDYPVVNDAGGQTIDASELIPANTRQVQVTFFTSASASLAIDDITMAYGLQMTPVAMEQYTSVSSQGALAMPISGLQPGTDYFYKVRGHNGELHSLHSNEIKVTTTGANMSGIETIADNAPLTVTVEGQRLIIHTEPNQSVNVYTIDGLRVASLTTSSTGRCETGQLTCGIYLTECANGQIAKALVK